MIAAFAPSQDGSQQAIDAFGQHAAAPGAVQGLAQSLPGGGGLLSSQQRESLNQGLFPQDLLSLVFDERQGVGLLIGFDLPQARQGPDSLLTPAPDQRGQGLLKDRVVGKQSIGPVDQVAAQLAVDPALPASERMSHKFTRIKEIKR